LVAKPRALLACLLAALSVAVVPKPAPAHAAGPQLDRVERGIIRRINQIRGAYGLPRLRIDRALDRSADYHSRDMLRADFFAHPSSNGQSFAQRVESFRRSSRIGETLAYVPAGDPQGSARRIVEMWMNSPPHRASLLNRGFRRIGVSRRRGTFGRLKVVVFTADFASAH
jgi:uncharacterized protein YkwD